MSWTCIPTIEYLNNTMQWYPTTWHSATILLNNTCNLPSLQTDPPSPPLVHTLRCSVSAEDRVVSLNVGDCTTVCTSRWNVNDRTDITTLTGWRAKESGVDVEGVAHAQISEALCYELVATLIQIPCTAKRRTACLSSFSNHNHKVDLTNNSLCSWYNFNQSCSIAIKA